MKRLLVSAVFVCLAALLAAFAWSAELRTSIAQRVTDTPYWILVSFVIGACGLVFLVLLARRSRRQDDHTMTNNEALRVAQQAVDDSRRRERAAAQSKTSPKSASTGPEPVQNFANAPIRRATTNVVDLERPSGNPGKSEPPTEKASPHTGSTKAPKHEDALYFLPFVNLSSGDVNYYDVLRRRSLPDASKPVFDRAVTGCGKEASAAFNGSLIERTIATSRQVFASLGDGSSLIVPLGSALLNSEPQWRSLSRLITAQRSLANGIVFAVEAEVLANTQTIAHQRVADLFQRGLAIACEGLALDLRMADRDMLSDLECLVCDYQDAFRTANLADTEDVTSAALVFFQGCNMTICQRNIVSEGDAADAIDLLATYGSGPFFSEPKRLRDADGQSSVTA